MNLNFVLPNSVVISEVGPRDGLQNLKGFVPTEQKVQFIKMLKGTGLQEIELTAFVRPGYVPQMRDAREILEEFINDGSNINYKVLVPNKKGLELAIKAGAKTVVAVLSASEKHNQNNVKKTVAESLQELKAMAPLAQENGVTIKANIATAFGYEDEKIAAAKVIQIAETLLEAGYAGITLCDTTGITEPIRTYQLCSEVIGALREVPIGVHFHKANGIEFANVLAALAAGIKIFDSASGGLGGCPFAPGATGNIATEDLVEFFARMGVLTQVDRASIKKCGETALAIQRDYYEKL